jgi:hypothetical protein
MTGKQKAILIGLGILDLLVVLGLGVIVIGGSQSAVDPAPNPAKADACSDALLADLTKTGGSVVLAWSGTTAHVTIRCEAPPTGPPEQYLWTVLDSFPTPLPTPCPVPETVLISVLMPGQQIHTAKLAGSDLAAWLRGTQSDGDLATRALYRTTGSATHP